MERSILQLIKPYLQAILVIVFVILLVLSFVPSVEAEGFQEEKDSDKLAESNENFAVPEKPATRKLQIGIKKRAEKCIRKANKGDTLHIHYRGTLQDTGAEFDSSYNRNDPLVFILGVGQVIKGWDQGLLGICAGEKRKLIIPPELGYGASGSPPAIPPDSTLIFEVECVKIEERKSEL